MRKFSLITGLFLAAVLFAGCRPTVATEPAQDTRQTVSGIVQSVTASDKPGTVIVSIQTDKGTQNISVSKNTTVAVEGQACTLDDINLFDIQGLSYNCTAVYNPGCDADAIAFNVVKIVE